MGMRMMMWLQMRGVKSALWMSAMNSKSEQ
jgi:hypothetical protein